MNQDYQCNFIVDVSAMEAFDKINQVSDWWTINIYGESKNLGDEFKVDFDETWSTMKIIDSVPGKKVAWLVEDCFLHFIKDKKEWKGTKIIFEISPKDNGTEIKFTHTGLSPAVECYGQCVKGWDFYMKTSLYKLIAEGKGNPDSRDLSKKKMKSNAVLQEQ